MGQCRTLDADVTIGCYYGDYSKETLLGTLFYFKMFYTHTLVGCKVHRWCEKRKYDTL